MGIGKYLLNPALAARKMRWQALYLGPQREVTLDTANGRLTFHSRDKLIGKELFVRGGYEMDNVRRAIALLREEGFLTNHGSGTMLDVGANIGMISIAMLRERYFERAIAFEPAPATFRLLQRNIAQNRLETRMHALPIALSSVSGEMALELSAYNSGDHRIRHEEAHGAFREERRATTIVTVRALDEILREQEIDPSSIRLAWVDIQGHEGHFFLGARDLLAFGVPVVSEFWPYGIARSGMSRAEYMATVSQLFTHVYAREGDQFARFPVAHMEKLFDRYSAPRQVSEIILVRMA